MCVEMNLVKCQSSWSQQHVFWFNFVLPSKCRSSEGLTTHRSLARLSHDTETATVPTRIPDPEVPQEVWANLLGGLYTLILSGQRIVWVGKLDPNHGPLDQRVSAWTPFHLQQRLPCLLFWWRPSKTGNTTSLNRQKLACAVKNQ